MAATASLPIPVFQNDSPFYVLQIPSDAAPITFAGSLHNFRHAPGCHRAKIVDTNYSRNDHKRVDLVSESSQVHSTRLVCECMNDFELDKQGVLEQMSRENVTHAFLQVLMMVSCYGVDKVLEDVEILQVISRYDFLSQFYAQKSEISWPSTNIRSQACLPLLSENLYRKSDLISEILPDEQVWCRFCRAFRQLNVRGHYIEDFCFKAPYEVFVDLPQQIFAALKWTAQQPKKAVIRLDTILSCDIESVLAIMSEVSMTKSWVPYFKFPMRMGLQDAWTTTQLGRLDKVSIYKLDMPWPLRNRDCLLHGWIVDDLDHNDSLVINFRAIDVEYPLSEILSPPADIPPETDKYCRIYVEGGCQATLVGEKRVYLEMLWDIDLKADIPISLIRFVGKTFMKAGLRALGHICQKVDSKTDPKWQEAMDSNKWFYGFINERVKQHEKKKQLRKEWTMPPWSQNAPVKGTPRSRTERPSSSSFGKRLSFLKPGNRSASGSTSKTPESYKPQSRSPNSATISRASRDAGPIKRMREPQEGS